MTKLGRIDGFLKSLEGKGIITADMQSVVFSPEFGMLGGDNLGTGDKSCTNYGNGCNGINSACTNVDVCTDKAINTDCKNANRLSPACNPPGKNSTSFCGTGGYIKNPATQGCKSD